MNQFDQYLNGVDNSLSNELKNVTSCQLIITADGFLLSNLRPKLDRPFVFCALRCAPPPNGHNTTIV